MKKYYAILFLGGNRTCTTGEPNKKTGRMSVACENYVFDSKKARDLWVEKQGDRERMACSKKYLRSKNLGCSMRDFEQDLACNSYYNESRGV